MSSVAINPRDALQYTLRRHIVTLFKEFLSLSEDLTAEHDEALAKLATALPTEYHTHINLADYLTEDRAERLRKVILQRGNDCARAVEEEIRKYRVEFI